MDGLGASLDGRVRAFVQRRYGLGLLEAVGLAVVLFSFWVGLYRGNLAALVPVPPWVVVAMQYAPILVGLFAATAIGLATRRQGLAPSPAIFLLGYGLVAGLATLWVLDGYREGAYYALSFVAACSFLVAVHRGLRAHERLQFLFEVTLLASVAMAAAFLCAAAVDGSLFAYFAGWTARLYGSRPVDAPLLWATANGVGRFAVLSALLAVAALTFGRRSWRPAAIAGLLASLVLLVVTVSRSSWIGFGLALAVLVTVRYGRRFTALVGAAGVAALAITGAATGVLGYLVRGQSWAQLASFSNRSGLWVEGLRMLGESPVIGFGFQADRVFLGEHLHNAWMQALFQGGVLGFALFAAAWLLAWRALVRLGPVAQAPPHQRARLAFATAVLTFLSVRSLVESTGAFYGVDLLLLAPLAGMLTTWTPTWKPTAAPTPGRRRVLMGAYAFAPPDSRSSRSGEDILGWSLAHQMARHHEVWVLASGEHERDARAALGETPAIHVEFIDLPRFLAWMRRRQGLVQLYAYMWQVRAVSAAFRLHREHRFDLFHHVTYANDWMASHVGALLPIPYVRGPGGGAHHVPRAFRRGRGLGFGFVQAIRTIAQRVLRLDPFFLVGQARAKAILVCNEEARRAVPGRWQSKTQLFPVNGIAAAEILAAPRRQDSSRFTVVSAARLVPIKGLDLALCAFAAFARERPSARYVIVGEGPEEPALRRLADALGIVGRVEWDGWKPRSGVLARMAEADTFLFPSLRDGGGAVVVEAMAQGSPVVCLDLGGPGTHVRDEWGIKVPAHDPEQAVRDLAAALVRLHDDAELRARLGENARRRASSEYEWDRLGDRLLFIYEQALQPSPAAQPLAEVVPG